MVTLYHVKFLFIIQYKYGRIGSLFMEKVLFGLSCTNTNQEIVDLVFDKAHEVRYFSMAIFSTV